MEQFPIVLKRMFHRVFPTFGPATVFHRDASAEVF